jgi:hypothetical protein
MPFTVVDSAWKIEGRHDGQAVEADIIAVTLNDFECYSTRAFTIRWRRIGFARAAKVAAAVFDVFGLDGPLAYGHSSLPLYSSVIGNRELTDFPDGQNTALLSMMPRVFRRPPVNNQDRAGNTDVGLLWV